MKKAVRIGIGTLILLSFTLIFPLVSASTEIANCTQLQEMNNNLSGNYILANNIDCSATSGWNWNGSIYKGFIPIGNDTANFAGSFDGQNHTIDGLFINRPATSYVGLFGYINTSISVGNVVLTNVNITGLTNVGGIAGQNDGIIRRCSSSGIIYSPSVQPGEAKVGGLVGFNYGHILESCSYGTVSANALYVGGLAGYNILTAALINNSYSHANVTAYSNSGAFLGPNYNAYVKSSYSKGYVTNATSDYIGGLIGYANNVGYITTSYWDNESTGQPTSYGGTAKTTTQMKNQSTYSGWDFDNVWQIDDLLNEGYPYLKWQSLIEMIITETLEPSTCEPSASVDVYGHVSLNNGTNVSNTAVYIYISDVLNQTNSTDANGDYNVSIIAPATGGTYPIKVNATYAGFIGENTKNLTVASPDSCTWAEDEDWIINISDNCTLNEATDLTYAYNLIVIGDNGYLKINTTISAGEIHYTPDNFDGGYQIEVLSSGKSEVIK